MKGKSTILFLVSNHKSKGTIERKYLALCVYQTLLYLVDSNIMLLCYAMNNYCG